MNFKLRMVHPMGAKSKINKSNEAISYDPTKKIEFKFDRVILEMFIGYTFSDDKSITKGHLNNLFKLIDLTDVRTYELNAALYTRITLLHTALTGKLHEGIERIDILKEYCRKENDEDRDEVISHIDEFAKLNKNEIKFISEAIEDRLKYAFILFHKRIIINEFLRIDQGDFDSLKEVTKSIKAKVSALLKDIRKVERESKLDTFSLDDDVLKAWVSRTLEETGNPELALKTGIRMLNDVLSPGLSVGRLHMFLASSGVFKSAFLLLLTYWIKKYNRVIPRRREKDSRPAVLLIVLENDIQETLIRLFNASVSGDSFSEYTVDEIVNMLREKGGLTLNDGETQILIRYYSANSFSPNDLRSLIDSFEDEGYEIIATVLDYLKLMKSDTMYTSEKERLGQLTTDLKNIAVDYLIPVMTAQQLNRSGDNAFANARDSGRQDLIKSVKRGDIADSWDVIQNADFVMILAIEIEQSTGKRYLSLSEVKKRWKTMTDVKMFHHPFVDGSTIMLIEDVCKEKSVSKLTLTGDFNVNQNNKIPEPKFNFGFDDSAELIQLND